MESAQCLNLLYDDIRIMDRQNETDTGTQPGSVPDDNLTVGHFTYPEIYRAVVTGNVALFRRNSEDIELSRLTQLVSPRGETVLHIAAQSGHDELVRAILGRHDLLGLVVAQNNWLRNTPLHATASAGHLSTVKMLVSAAKEYSQQQRGSLKMVLGIKNKQNDTALHLALRNRHLEVARFLFEADDDPEGVDYFNSEYKSPLYMAAEAGYEVLFELMMQKHAAYVDGTAEVVQEYRWSVAIAAVLVKNRGILTLVLREWPDLFAVNDRSKRAHPVVVAAVIGYLDGIRDILDKFRECSFVRWEGNFPITLASTWGHVEIIQEFLKHCPDSRELCNMKNQNILHAAARWGKDKAVSYILNNPELQMLINEKDSDGNTPLHLAAKAGYLKIVSILTWDSRVDLKVLNEQGMTALDVAESHVRGPSVPSFRQRLTWQALRIAGAPRAKKMSHHQNPASYGTNNEFYKDRINTLTLVSTLVATLTFAAGLTSPGNDDDSKTNPGMFHAFVITNAVALYSSISVVVALIWAQLGDRDLVLASLKFTLPVLGLSLAMVSLAFMAGAYLVAYTVSTGLAYSVLVLASLGFLTFFVIFIPLFTTSSLKHRFARYVYYYSFCLLVKVILRGDDN